MLFRSPQCCVCLSNASARLINKAVRLFKMSEPFTADTSTVPPSSIRLSYRQLRWRRRGKRREREEKRGEGERRKRGERRRRREEKRRGGERERGEEEERGGK